MKKNSNEYLSEIETTYRTIDKSFDKVIAECKSEEEKKMVVASRDAARNAFWQAVDTNFSVNSVLVERARNDLSSVNKKLKGEIESLKNIALLVNVMEDAVRLAVSLAALAAA